MISRKANKNDIPQILPLWQDLMDTHAAMERMFMPVEDAAAKFGAFIESLLDNENYLVAVAEINEKVVGYIVASAFDTPEVFAMRRRMYIQDTVIDPDYRRQGVAKLLMDTAMAFAKEQKVDKIDLLVAVKNEGGNKFWKEMGFEPALTYMNLYL